MSRPVALLRRARMPESVRASLPWTVSMVVALIAVAVAGTSPDGRRAAPAPALAGPTGTAGQLTNLEMSRNQPIAEVRKHYAFVETEHAIPSRVKGFLPIYAEAGATFGVNWRLIASIHRQETAFSASTTTYHGKNFAGCCAGPMQFNVTNGPVSTWERYRGAFRSGIRPVTYPHPTARHPSIYDDFDAIMAAGKLLSASGSGTELGADAWHAAYDYYGHDLFGITYADTVIARAQGWVRDGFCVNCLVDERLIKQLDKKYGVAERKALGEEVAKADPKAAAREARRLKRHRRLVRERRRHRAKVRAREARAAREREAEMHSVGAAGKHTGRNRAGAVTPTPTPGKRPPSRPAATPAPTQRPRPTTAPAVPSATPESTPSDAPESTTTPDGLSGLLGGGPSG